jgi:hypothetical protein
VDFSLACTQTSTRVSIWIVEGISNTLYSVCVCACAHLHTRAHAHAHRLTHNACAHTSCISSPRIRIYQPESLDEDLQLAAIEYLMANSPKNRLSRQNSGNGSHSLFSPTLSVRHSRSLTHSSVLYPTLCPSLTYCHSHSLHIHSLVLDVFLSLVCKSPCVSLSSLCVSLSLSRVPMSLSLVQ